MSNAAEHHRSRRLWPLTEKRRIVELTLVGGASTRAIAFEHGVHPTSLSHWKRQYHAGKLGEQRPAGVGPAAPSATFLPVSVAAIGDASQCSTPRYETHARNSVVQLMLASGATLRVETDRVDVTLLCALVTELRR